MKIKRVMYSIVMPVIRLYWGIFKPQSYGVKVVLIHPHDQNKILLVRHTYGNTTLWNIPGGGYNPKKETSESAAQREVSEELHVSVHDMTLLGEYRTEGEGKKDIVTLFAGTIKSTEDIRTNSEISETDWAEVPSISSRGNDVARVARRAVEKLVNARSTQLLRSQK